MEFRRVLFRTVYGLFANASNNDEPWIEALDELRARIDDVNGELFGKSKLRKEADAFINQRLDETQAFLADLQRLSKHGHFELEAHLFTVREDRKSGV